MKKLVALALCVAVIIPLIVASCDTQDSNADTVNIELNKYTIIRAQKISETLLSAIVDMKKEIDNLSGGNIKLSDDWINMGTEPDSTAYEILIGATNRQQTSDILTKIEGAAYSIALTGNKIVIIGTNDAATADGVRYFMDTYISTLQNGILILEKNFSYTSSQYNTVNIVSSGKCNYTVVYKDGLDNQSSSERGDTIDYEVMLAQNIRKKITDLTGVNVNISTDWLKSGDDASDKYEILIGTTNRPETAEVRASLGAADWCVKITGKKIVICGWSETTTELAVNSFYTLLKQSIKNDADGNTGITFLENENIYGTYSEWVTDIPKYDGGEHSGCVDANFGQLEYYITGTNSMEFNAYRDKLEGSGYTLYFENKIGENLFATYTGNGNMIHTYFVEYQNAVRIITGLKYGKAGLPNVADESYTKITDSVITQMTLNYADKNFGMCYIITLEDGSFIVYDGGGDSGKVDHIRLYNLLTKLNKRSDGEIVIAAWILTHEHWDHFMVFYDFCTTYGSKVEIEQFIANTPTKIVGYNSNNPNTYIEDGQFNEASLAAGGIKLVKPHTGQIIKIRNASVEVLFTQEDIFPNKLYFFNDSSMITRMLISGQSIIWLGDTYTVGSDVVAKMYGSYIKSDMVQVSHHGYIGASKELYNFISPLIAFWPTSPGEFKNMTSGKNVSVHGIIDYYIAYKLGVKENFCAGPNNISITLPYIAGSNMATTVDVPLN